jgi:exosortase C (VPDSG-CTERM-specific)
MATAGELCPQVPWRGFWTFLGLWSAAFAVVLIRLIRFSFGSELDSYIPLIPCISVYLLYIKRHVRASDSPVVPWADSGLAVQRGIAVLLWAVSVALVILQVGVVSGPSTGGEAVRLLLPVTAYVTGIIGGVIFFFGTGTFMRAAFPLLFLYYIVPIPPSVTHLLRVALQQGSAETAYLLFKLTGTPVFREGLVFCLPDLTIQVAEECSGIHSSLVLYITSLVAGYVLLGKLWSRTLLVLVVIPLSLLRNGVRIVTISLLTIHVDPGVIHGPLHQRGGPIFFLLSLAVFAGIVWLLRWYEKKQAHASVAQGST